MPKPYPSKPIPKSSAANRPPKPPVVSKTKKGSGKKEVIVPELKSVRDEKFAQYVASGISQSEAFRRVSGKTANANNHGDEYMAKRGMKERIAEIRAETGLHCVGSINAGNVPLVPAVGPQP